MSATRMTIGVPKEPFEYQMRVSVAPQNVERLLKLGYEVLVEHDAGIKADLYDQQYETQGARIVDAPEAWGADVVVCMNTPPAEQLAHIKRGALLITRVNPRANPELLDTFSQMGITVLALDCVPRISRAQSLDVLSSMMSIAGYKAVVEAADAFAARTCAGWGKVAAGAGVGDRCGRGRPLRYWHGIQHGCGCGGHRRAP